MLTKTGVVRYVGYKNLTNSTVWSFALVEDDNYYRTKFDRPNRENGDKLEEGDKVKFNYEKTKYGNEVIKGSLQVRPGPGAPPKTAKKEYINKPGKKNTENWDARAKYWEDKEKYDHEVIAPMYNYRSAAQMAKDIVLKAHELDLVPKGKKKADALDDLIGQVALVRDQLFEDLQLKVRALEGGNEVPEEPEKIEDIQKEEKPIEDLDDWSENKDDWDE